MKLLQKLQKNRYIPWLFLLVFVFVIVLPLLIYGQSAAYLNIDPEMAYIGNALSYINSHQIYYTSHPGTPVIELMSFSYWPLRIYAKLIAQQGFINWTFDNLDFIFVYSRLVQCCVFATSLIIFLKVILRKVSTNLIGAFGILAMALFPFSFKLGLTILAETYSFLFVALWILAFNHFEEKRSPITLLIMGVLSGFAIAVKYNNVFLLLASILLVFCLNGLSFKQKFYNLLLTCLVSIGGFIAGTWPIRRYYLTIFKEAFSFLVSRGPHGLERSFVNPFEYLKLGITFISNNPWMVGFLLLGTAFMLFLIIKKKISWRSPEVIIYLVTSLVNLFYLKYGLDYYLLPGYFLLLYVILRIMDRCHVLTIFAAVLIILFPSVASAKAYFLGTSKAIQNAQIMENYVSQIRKKEVTLWDFAPVKDFMYIWIRSWTDGLFKENLKTKRPDLLELKSDYKTVYLDFDTSKYIFDVCWNKLIIREERAKVFLSLYKEKHFEYKPIFDTGIWEISSDHCGLPRSEILKR